MTKHTQKPLLAIGQLIELRHSSELGDKIARVHHRDNAGRYYAQVCDEFACGEFIVTDEDVLAVVGQHHDVARLESDSAHRNRCANAQARVGA